MLFNSPEFALFFPLVTLLYFLLPHGLRWALLLVASCLFYMAFVPLYILILFFTIGVDYAAGLLIEGSQGSRRKLWLVASIVANVGVLCVFKYANFASHNLTVLLQAVGATLALPRLDILLPIGLSFHTFQSLSYTIEVYRGAQKAERHLGIFALYVMFYPQLVAGPIERPQNMLHQFHERHQLRAERAISGMRLMLWGLFKKVVVADRMAAVVDMVYNDPTAHQGPALLLATVAFAWQIYCDFSGYSDIALGAARVMGFELMVNFRRPYYARSIAEFWRRWHISLSTWFRDYVYIPLGGSRHGFGATQRNLLITFLVSGLWHGASWNFVIWGALHGTFLVVSNLLARTGLPSPPAWLRIVITFCLADLAWIFFRARTFADACYVLTHLGTGWGMGLKAALVAVGLPGYRLLTLLLVLAVLEAVQVAQERGWSFTRLPGVVRWSLDSGLVALIYLFGVFNRSQFIYFQF